MDRIRVFQIVVFLVAAVIIARLFYWQFVAKLTSNIDEFELNSEIPASRGEIYTKDNFPIVTNQEAFLLYAKPAEINRSPKDIAKSIGSHLISEKYSTPGASLTDADLKTKEEEIKEKEEELESKLGNKSLLWVQLARKIPKETKEKIEEQKIKGFGFERDEKRLYPEASMAAQVLGFVGFDKFGRDTGYFGLEGFWDLTLKGKPGSLGGEKDPLGLPILVGAYKRIEPKKGGELYLSIDRSIQYIVEKSLTKAVDKYGAKDGSVIIEDPKTGQILAMATYPTYNPALRQEFEEKVYKNPVVADTFEPGSIFKPIVMASALDLGFVEPQTQCTYCDGPKKIANYDISTWNKKYFPNSTMTEVIQHSDNVGMTFVSEKLGVDKFLAYITKFGFGKVSGIDLQEEASGVLKQKAEWRDIDLATASFGQGIAVTPIQIVQAISAIANEGKLISPRVTLKIKDENGEKLLRPKEEKQIISPKTATQITEMMVNAVEKGEAKVFAPKGYRIAGKTGTAQIPVAGRYDPDKTIASFVGFAPANNPRFVMMVRFTEPSSSPFGAETAAPTFFEIAKEIFNIWGIPPEK
ncbi:penicillin-binding protein 2 [Candidatus Curtissbacteria bacterium]|nr:penicillin-binding protein 2 [Candidatus Curtissbacteria bacterium]